MGLAALQVISEDEILGGDYTLMKVRKTKLLLASSEAYRIFVAAALLL